MAAAMANIANMAFHHRTQTNSVFLVLLFPVASLDWPAVWNSASSSKPPFSTRIPLHSTGYIVVVTRRERGAKETEQYHVLYLKREKETIEII